MRQSEKWAEYNRRGVERCANEGRAFKGLMNVHTVAMYLRGLGIDVSEATEVEWADAADVRRQLLKFHTKAVEWGHACECLRGHRWFVATKSRKAQRDCPECGFTATGTSLRWTRSSDGVLHDRRPRSEQWRDPYAQPTESTASEGGRYQIEDD